MMTREREITIYRAAWVMPVVEPAIEDGAVAVKDGIIVGLGRSRQVLKVYGGGVVDLGEAILMPGFVNAHTHLDLSALDGAAGEGGSFVDWVRGVVNGRLELSPEQIESAAAREVKRLCASGTALIGDVTNTGLSNGALPGSGMRATVFHEVIGFRSGDAEHIFTRCVADMEDLPQDSRLRDTICPHGPHSVSPPLLKMVADHTDSRGMVSAVHLAESREEDLFIRECSGPFRSFLEERGVWEPSWKGCPQGPVSYLDGLGFLRPGTICVHLVQAGEDDLRLLARRGASACVCPRSNRFTGVGRPPIRTMLEAGLRVALGTDSLASNEDLNVLAEAQHLWGNNPGIRPQEVVRMFTLSGAEALGWGELGCIREGKVARFALVPVTGGVCDNPYEYVLERADPGDVGTVENLQPETGELKEHENR